MRVLRLAAFNCSQSLPFGSYNLGTSQSKSNSNMGTAVSQVIFEACSRFVFTLIIQFLRPCMRKWSITRHIVVLVIMPSQLVVTSVVG